MLIFILVAIFVALFVALPLLGLAVGAVVSAVVVGLVIGALGRLVVPGRQPIGLVRTALLGLIGSIVGSFVGYHVLGIGAFSILLEIAIAAAAVALYSGRRGRAQRLGSGHPPGPAGRLP